MTSDGFQPVGHSIRQRRLELGLTRAELVERLDDQMTVADIERLEGERVWFPSWPRLLRLAEALETSPTALLGESRLGGETP